MRGKREFSLIAFLGASLLILALSSCIPLDERKQVSTVPVGEALVQFFTLGNSVWRQPGMVSYHVVLQGAEQAQISVASAEGRSENLSLHKEDASQVTHIKTDLSELVEALGGDQKEYSACVFKVRVRMVRTDGSVFDKSGCRSARGWSRGASRLARTIATAFVEKQKTQSNQMKPKTNR